MDLIKTGMLISNARKNLNMTQQDLANKLHVTDKAVSKWERGICYPDISILIPLTEVLNISLYDLLNGKINGKNEIEMALKSTINYSTNEIKKKKRKYIIISLICIFMVLSLSASIVYTFSRDDVSGLTDRETLYGIDYYVEDDSIDNIILKLPLKWERLNYVFDKGVLTIFYNITFDDIKHVYLNDDMYIKESIIYNATVIFTTVKDVKSIKFNFSDKNILVEKNVLLKQYNINDFSEAKNNWDSIVFKRLCEKDFIKQTFNNFIENKKE